MEEQTGIQKIQARPWSVFGIGVLIIGAIALGALIYMMVSGNSGLGTN